MSTIVYQEVQSTYHESFFNESRTLSLKLNSSKDIKSYNSFSNTTINSSSKPAEDVPRSTSSASSSIATSGCFSSIEALSSKKDVKESVYVHPPVKKSTFMLSDKSLQMCTESLGSETGACDMDSGMLFSSMTTVVEETLLRQKLEKTKVVNRRPLLRQKIERTRREKIFVDQGKFPPPLTTISGSCPIQVKPYRENGRLIIEAVTSPPQAQSYMQAERSGGRLKLTLVNDFSDDEIDVDDCTNSFDDDQEDTYKEINNNGLKSVVENEEQQQQEEEKEEELCDKKGNVCLLEDDKSGKKVEIGVKLGFGKIQRPRRCKERGQGNKRLINLEPFWVTI